jgi:hypothetical protein
MNDRRLRQLWRDYWRLRHRLNERYEQAMEAWYELPVPVRMETPKPKAPHLPFPEELQRLTCGARTRKGTPCKRRDLHRGGRCPLHGGLSTGPRTEQGKRQSSRNGFRATLPTNPLRGYQNLTFSTPYPGHGAAGEPKDLPGRGNTDPRAGATGSPNEGIDHAEADNAGTGQTVS